MSKIKKFISNNDISFTEGNRNTTVVTLIGYAQHSDISKDDLKIELSEEIKNDSFINKEIDRLWNYCKINNYKDYWNKAVARSQYTY
jgi:hypothetical protein